MNDHKNASEHGDTQHYECQLGLCAKSPMFTVNVQALSVQAAVKKAAFSQR